MNNAICYFLGYFTEAVMLWQYASNLFLSSPDVPKSGIFSSDPFQNVQKKKKLLVTASTFPRWKGDTEPRFVLDLAAHMTEEFDVTVLVPAARAEKRPDVQAAGTGFGSGTVIPPGICGAVLVCP